MEKQEKKVCIIGAGLTGLVTAFYLKKQNIPFLLIEKSDRTGGVIHTHKKGDFIFETGPNTGVLGNPEAAELFEDLGNACELEIADPNAKKRLVLKNGKWHALPSGLFSAVGTPLFTLKDKFRVLGEPFRKKGTNPDEVLSDMVRRRLGKSFLEYAIDPFILGIYAGDPDYLVPKYALPKLYNLEQDYGSFIRGAVKKAKEPKTERDKKASKEVFSVKGGLSNLVKALSDYIGDENIILNAQNIKADAVKEGFKLNFVSGEKSHEIKCKKLITTVGSFALPELLPFTEPDKLKNITDLKYAQVTAVSFGFEKWQGIDIRAFGGLIPFKERRDILGVLFLSSFLSGRAPKGGAMFTVYTGGFRRPELAQGTEEQIKQSVGKEFSDLMGLQEFNPAFIELKKHRYAIPQYGAESKKRFEAINFLEKKYPGLHLAGNIRNGIGMADRIKQARDISNRIRKAVDGKQG